MASPGTRVEVRPRLRLEGAILALAAGTIYFCLGAALASRPGVSPDEALTGGAAAASLRYFPDRELLRTFHSLYDGYNLPLIHWPLQAAFKIFGVSVLIARLMGLFFASAAVSLLVALVASRHGRYWARIFALVLATSPGMILPACYDTALNSSAVLLASLCAVLGSEALRKKGQLGWLFAAGATAGLGIANKLNFLWLVLAVPPAAWIATRGRPRMTRPNLRDWLAAVAGTAFGAAQVLSGHWVHPLEALRHPPPYTESLLSHLAHIDLWTAVRTRMLLESLTGTAPYYLVSGRAAPFPWGFVLTVAIAPVVLILIGPRRVRSTVLRESAFWALAAAFAFAIACLAPMKVKAHHFPPLEIFLGLALISLTRGAAGLRPARMIGRAVAGLAVAAATANILFLYEFRATLIETGGSSLFQSEGIALARWAEDYSRRHPGAVFVCDDWLGIPLFLQSKGMISPATPAFAAHGGRDADAAIDALLDGRLVWVRRSPLSADLDLHSQDRDETVLALEREIPDRLLAVFYDRTGRPWATAQTAAPVGRLRLLAAWKRAFVLDDNGRLSARAPVDHARDARSARPLKWLALSGGDFVMGDDGKGGDSWPAHLVSVPPFEIAQAPVTAGQFDACVRAGACQKPACAASDPNDPVVCVTWNQAERFSAWVGGRLPSEAEWEYAARGAGQDHGYPWGSSSSDCSRRIGVGCSDHARRVCSTLAGKTAQGLCDMIGDRWEWVHDVYHSSYRGAPNDGSSWEDFAWAPNLHTPADPPYVARTARSAYRTYFAPWEWSPYLGFRPVRDR